LGKNWGIASWTADKLLKGAGAGADPTEIDVPGLAIFGDGNDGNVTISVNTTLSRDMFYNNLTVNSGVTLNPGGYRIFVKGTLTNNGLIARDGNNATLQLGGEALADAELGGSGAGGGGTLGFGGEPGGDGGMGGAGGGGGSDGGSGGAASATTKIRSSILALGIGGAVIRLKGGGGGGSGSGDSVNYGGGGGSGGGVILVVAKIITNNGTIRANGGNGAGDYSVS
jgi:hypothetical protein